MKISTVQLRQYNQQTKAQHQSEKEIPITKVIDIKMQEFRNQSLKERLKSGEQLEAGEIKFIEMIEQAAQALVKPPVEIHYFIHEKTGQISIKVINAESHEVIREIPSEKILEMGARMCELAGIFVDKKS